MLETPALTPTIAPTSRSVVRGLVRTARPRQWVKNALVVAAAGAAGALGHDDVPVRISFAFVAFCLMASGIYAINDVRDIEEDRQHPRKRFRPVASGQVSPRVAVSAGVTAILIGTGISFVLTPLLGIVALGYVVLTLSYTLVWRHIVILDIIAVAGGFVLRAVAGGVTADVPLSIWFTLVVAFAAVLIATGKRRAELVRAEAGGVPRRRVLTWYTDSALRLVMLVSVMGALAVYCLWAFDAPLGSGIPWRLLTVLPFAAAVLRYIFLARRGAGEAPEELLYGDPFMRIASVAWLALFALQVHATA